MSTEIERGVRPQNFHEIALVDAIVQTNLPLDVDVVSKLYDPSFSFQSKSDWLNPAAFDQLAAGIFTIREEAKADQHLVISETKLGKVVGGLVLDRVWFSTDFSNVSAPLLQPFGYVISSDEPFRVSREGAILSHDYEGDYKLQHLAAVPAPETLRRAAADQGVRVRLLPDYGLIPPDAFLAAYAEDEYPVATGRFSEYHHDIDDDHITAIKLGAALLRTHLADAAQYAIGSKDSQLMGYTTSSIDSYTSELRSTIARHPLDVFDKTRMSDEKRVDSLVHTGRTLGIRPHITRRILKRSLEQAHDLGVPVRRHDSLSMAGRIKRRLHK